jgi:DNA-binding transcriptional LysR family regulator
MSQITLAQIRAVEAVARHGSFTRAAEELGVSQPTVSMQVRAVEESCNQRLFVRSGGNVSLSPGAGSILVRVRVATKSIEELERHLAGTASLKIGSLSFGFSAHRIIMPIMRRFVELHPAIALRARSASSAELIAGIESGVLDVAAVTLREADPRFATFRISSRGVVVYARKGHDLCRSASLNIRKLAGVPLVLWNRGSHTRQILEAEAGRIGIALSCALEVGSWDAAFASTAAGIGLGIALEGEVEANDRIDVSRLDGGAFNVGQFLICLPEYRRFAAVDALFSIAGAKA